MWVVNGTSLTGYDISGNSLASSGASVTAPSGASFFSVAVSGSGNASENIFVSDSAAHTLYEYSWNGSSLSQNSTVFQFASDPSGGAISPQEIALDPAGNLWTTSFDGQIQEYTSACQGTTPCSGTQILASGSSVSGARGIMIVASGTGNCTATDTSGCRAYVTVQGTYGSGYLDYFSASGTANPGITQYASLGAATTGTATPQGTGQMRGVTEDSVGDIFYADNTWGGAGTDNGYVCEVAAGTAAGSTCVYSGAYLSGLNGPNELISGQGTNGNGNGQFKAGCSQIFVASYYAGTITEVNTGNKIGGQSVSCGTQGSVAFLSTSNPTISNITGIAMAVGDTGSIGGNEGPTFLFGPDFVSPSPEPGTWVLMLSAFLGGVGLLMWRRCHQARA